MPVMKRPAKSVSYEKAYLDMMLRQAVIITNMFIRIKLVLRPRLSARMPELKPPTIPPNGIKPLVMDQSDFNSALVKFFPRS